MIVMYCYKCNKIKLKDWLPAFGCLECNSNDYLMLYKEYDF